VPPGTKISDVHIELAESGPHAVTGNESSLESDDEQVTSGQAEAISVLDRLFEARNLGGSSAYVGQVRLGEGAVEPEQFIEEPVAEFTVRFLGATRADQARPVPLLAKRRRCRVSTGVPRGPRAMVGRAADTRRS
jgi:hypothetical protein